MNSVPEKDQLKELARLKNISRQRLNIVAITASLILFLMVSFFIVSGQLKRYCENFCFYILHLEAENIKKDMNRYIAFFQDDIDTLGKLLEEEEDLRSEDVQEFLRIYEDKKIVSQLGILFSDNQVMLSGGTFLTSPDEISYDDMVRQAPLFSNIREGAKDPDQRILYYIIPIEGKDEGEIRGMLFGVIELSYLSKNFEVSLFGREISISIVDSENMDNTLIDLYGHESHDGHGDAQEREETAAAKETEEIMYALCEPMDINGWSLLLSIPKKVILDMSQYIESLLFRLGLLQSAAFLTYFVWTLWRTKKESRFKESEMRHIYYMYNVQQILFDAYRQPESITLSLELIARTAGAKGGILAAIEGDSVSKLYAWQEKQEDMEARKTKRLLAKDLAADMLVRQTGYTVSVQDEGTLDGGLKEIMDRFAIKSLTAIPIGGQDRRIIGVLAIIDGDKAYDALDSLISVAFSYSMALDNIRAYETIEKMGTTDALTGLKNRNLYEDVLKRYEEECPDRLTCIYADANGLHELNNSQGHAAGDKMLKSVADALREAFEDGIVFRIGGDEFLVFTDMDEASAAGFAAEAKGQVGEKGYHVSIGVASGGGQVPAGAVVKAAEQRMYEDKRQYYLGTNDRRKMR